MSNIVVQRDGMKTIVKFCVVLDSTSGHSIESPKRENEKGSMYTMEQMASMIWIDDYILKEKFAIHSKSNDRDYFQNNMHPVLF